MRTPDMEVILYLTGAEAYDLAETPPIIEAVREGHRQRGGRCAGEVADNGPSKRTEVAST